MRSAVGSFTSHGLDEQLHVEIRRLQVNGLTLPHLRMQEPELKQVSPRQLAVSPGQSQTQDLLQTTPGLIYTLVSQHNGRYDDACQREMDKAIFSPFLLTSAPSSSKNFMQSTCPDLAATCKADSPFPEATVLGSIFFLLDINFA